MPWLRCAAVTRQASGTTAEHAGLTVPFPPCQPPRRLGTRGRVLSRDSQGVPAKRREPRTCPNARHPSAVDLIPFLKKKDNEPKHIL